MKKNFQTWGLHWFRRDLRITGNEALRLNWKKSEGRILGFFCFDSKFLSRPDFSYNRFAFFIKTLSALKKEMQDRGGDLLVIDAPPLEAFGKILTFGRPGIVTWNRDYEPYARKRDDAVKDFLQSQNIEISTHRDHLIFEPYEILKSEKLSDYYQIYSPYGKKWFAKLNTPEGQARINSQKSSDSYFKNPAEQIFKITWKDFLKNSKFPFQDALDSFAKENEKHVTIEIPQAGSLAAFEHLQEFKKKIKDYNANRDIPSLPGTSQLSIYLKNGSLVSSQILHELKLLHNKWDIKNGPTQYVKEIAWREFYYSILFHRPDVENTSFHAQYTKIKWENNKAFFKRWQEGTTGFPIVDAGMRQLLKTGWMHNRVRMIVASFLTKDLLIDWKWGENHFMKYLLDGDLAPNNGGWQWAASTGCDPQPYFRIFNPWLQSKKFDPDGIYIKTYIPELKNAPANSLHDPEFDRSIFKYPNPLVNHKVQKNKAISLYRK